MNMHWISNKAFRILIVLLLAVLAAGLLPQNPAYASTGPYIGEIAIFPFDPTLPVQDWAICNGQLLSINQNQNLFGLIGTTYGGDGQSTFALPDLRGRVAVDMGNGYSLGERGGEANHTLTIDEMPVEQHATVTPGTLGAPAANALLARAQSLDRRDVNLYGPAGEIEMFTPAGGGQPHSNMQPYLVLNFYISLRGVDPRL